MIRLGTGKDIPDILPMIRDFWSMMDYDVDFEPSYSDYLLKMSVDHGLLIVLEIDSRLEGFLCLIKSPLIFNSNYFMASELGFWVNPVHRKGIHAVKMLKKAIEVCEHENVHYMSMTLLEVSDPERVEKLYKRFNFLPTERSYRRVIH